MLAIRARIMVVNSHQEDRARIRVTSNRPANMLVVSKVVVAKKDYPNVVNAWKNEVRHRRTVAIAEPKLAHERGEPGPSFEERDEIWAAIRKLPPRQRACLVLR